MANGSHIREDNPTGMGREVLEEIAPHCRHRERPIQRDRAALLVVDMQEYFLNPGARAFMPAAPAIVPNIKSLQDAFLNHRRPVVQTRHLNTAEDAAMMAVWWRELITPDHPHAGIVNTLCDTRARVVDKCQYDAFFDTDLHSFLREKGISQLVVAGIKTHLCCDTTSRSAFVRGLEVFFCVDATASDNPALHVASLKCLSNGFAVPVLTREVTAAIGGGS